MRTDFLHKAAGEAEMAEVVLALEGAVPFKIAATDASYLENTYAPSFVNEMAIQLTAEIESRMMVSGLAESDIELELVFAPGTYMEHPQGDFTYRRLLISTGGRAVKDLWIRWRRVGEGKNFTVCDEIAAEDIQFSLGEDVPQKVREKEYRFLVQADAEKYRAAMGRKNVTEWREIIKRAVKRGTLTKITIDEKVAEHAGLIKDKLEELLGKMQPVAEVSQEPVISVSEEKDEAYEKAMAYMRSFVAENKADAPSDSDAEESEETLEEDVIPEVDAEDTESEDEMIFEAEAVAADEILEEAAATIASDAEEEAAVEPALVSVDETEDEEEPVQESFVFAKPVEPAIDIDALRSEMEKKLRAEMLEKEQELLHREYELERKKREFAAEIKEHELNRAEREIELRRQAQNQARLEWEAKERDRLAAQALEAIELRKAEEARIAEEARRAEEARIAEEARKAEEARIAEEARKAEEARIAEEARKAEEARIAEEARRAEEARIAEEARKAEEARVAAAANSPLNSIYTYTEKKVHLIFRHPVDPNVMTRIQALMTDTIRYFGKEHVFIKVKATIPAEDTVDLHFTQFPQQEHQLLVDMIQVLGNSDLGICRVLVD